MIAAIISGVVLLVLLLFMGLVLFVAVIAGITALRHGRPHMARWKSRLIRDRVNRYLVEQAEEQAVKDVVQAVGYELSE